MNAVHATRPKLDFNNLECYTVYFEGKHFLSLEKGHDDESVSHGEVRCWARAL